MKVLFVCMGNICRSPSAQGVFSHAIEQHGLATEFASASTHDYHLGAPPDQRAIMAAQRRGISIAHLRARQLQASDFARFEQVLAMDRTNLAAIRKRAPEQLHSRIGLVLDFAPQQPLREVPDPYYGDTRDFELVLDLLQLAAAGWIKEVLSGRLLATGKD